LEISSSGTPPQIRTAARLSHSRLVGQLNHEASGAIDFRYDPTWLHGNTPCRFPFRCRCAKTLYRCAGISGLRQSPARQPGIRKKVAERVGAEGIDASAFSQHSAAIASAPYNSCQKTPSPVLPASSMAIRSKMQKSPTYSKSRTQSSRLERDEDFRISIAGAQEKTALLRYKGHWQKPAGTTPTTHIFKPQIGELPNGSICRTRSRMNISA